MLGPFLLRGLDTDTRGLDNDTHQHAFQALMNTNKKFAIFLPFYEDIPHSDHC